MGFEFNSPQDGKHVFWLSQRALGDRLASLIVGFPSNEVIIKTTELAGNASFVNYVRLHQLTHQASNTTLHVVEKSIRKVVGISSLEARFHRERGVLDGSQHFQHPRCYGVIETPQASLIFTEYVKGKAPRMYAIATQMAQGIAELESLTWGYLHSTPKHRAWRYWQMDFFRPWYLLRPRFSFARCFRHLRALALEDSRFAGLEAPLRGFITELRAQAREVQRSPRCFCHLDYLRKNLFVSRQGLQLIDWSEVKVGRIGFDAGAYLSALFRRNEMPLYGQARDEFLAAYSAALAPSFDAATALVNARYLFLLNSLWNCMRLETIEEFRASDRLPLLKEKLEYLLSLKGG
jgi:hypothetical protein